MVISVIDVDLVVGFQRKKKNHAGLCGSINDYGGSVVVVVMVETRYMAARGAYLEAGLLEDSSINLIASTFLFGSKQKIISATGPLCIKESYDNLFTLKVHHNGYFTSPPDRRYNNVLVDWFDLVDSEPFSINEYDSLLEDLGFKDDRILFSHFRVRRKSLDEGFAPLMFGEDVLSLLWHVPRDIEIEVYVENGVSLVEKQMMEVCLAKGNGVLIEEIVKQMWSDEFQFGNLLFKIDHEFDLDLSQDPKEKVEEGMQWDLHTLNDDDDDDLLQLDDPIVWQQDNYHGDNEEEDIALLFAELDQLLEYVAFLNVKIRESVVGIDPPIVVVNALVVLVDARVIALEEEIQRPRKRKREMENESASAIVTFGKPNKRRRLNPTNKTEKGMEDKSGGFKARASRSIASKAKASKFKEISTLKNLPQTFTIKILRSGACHETKEKRNLRSDS
ncbi:hypothetical protein Tco_1159685 [Tanacetum coccineum]